MGELKPPGKPFDISKWEVQDAWEKVKANKGAPGVDKQTLGEFESDLKNNLYRIWNPWEIVLWRPLGMAE